MPPDFNRLYQASGKDRRGFFPWYAICGGNRWLTAPILSPTRTTDRMTHRRQPPRLLDQVRNAIRLRHYSIRIERAYVKWIRTYILFHGKNHPAQLGATHVGAFLSYLAIERNVAASTQNQALCAIVFLYRNVLDMELGEIGNLVFAKRTQQVAEVFNKDVVIHVLKK